MKFFIAFIALAAILGSQAASLTDEQKQKLAGYHKECLAQSGVDPAQIENAKKGNFPSDDKFKTHLFCVSQKIGLQNAAGELQKDVIIPKLTGLLKDQAVAEKVYAECGQNQSSPAETAFAVLKCYHEKTPDHVSFV